MKQSAEARDRDFHHYVARRTEQETPKKLSLANAHFERALAQAHLAGKAALEVCLEGPGWCSVHVRFPEGLFAAWLVKTGNAKYNADFDGKQRAVRLYLVEKKIEEDVHDCDRLEAYAEAFVRALAVAGIDAYVESNLD
jgi:hypothetical protein